MVGRHCVDRVTRHDGLVMPRPRTSRDLFVEPLLIAPDAPTPKSVSRYDESRDLTVLLDGRPLVEAIPAGGTETITKSDGERDDVDNPALTAPIAGTTTYTAIRAEREDDDAPAAWGGTQLDTRRFPGDVEQD
jgi:hypothetical protein